jgi:hypothetical protein
VVRSWTEKEASGLGQWSGGRLKVVKNNVLEGGNETKKPREHQLRRKERAEEGKRKNLPSSPNNHTTSIKKPHKGGTFSLPREKEELLSLERSRKFFFLFISDCTWHMQCQGW